jgi:hypothetical protein
MVMAPADNRITIASKATGELMHGIKGHVPDGWSEYKPESEKRPPVRK